MSQRPKPFHFGASECERKTPAEIWADMPISVKSGVLQTDDNYDTHCPNCALESVLVLSGGIMVNSIRVGQVIEITYYCPNCKTKFGNGQGILQPNKSVKLLDIRVSVRKPAEGQNIKKRVRK